MTDSNATYFVDVVCDLPDHPAGEIRFMNVDFFVSGATEVFPRQTYTLTLNATGQGTQRLPCPDNTGDAAARWWVVLPSKTSRVSIAYSAGSQDLSDVLASTATTTAPDAVTAALAGKANKVSGAVAGNLASLTSEGDLADSGSEPADFDAAGAAASVAGDLSTHAGLTTTAHGGVVADVQLGFNGEPADGDIDFVKLTRACTFLRTATSSNVSGEGEAGTGAAATAVFSLYRVPRDGGTPVLIETITFTSADKIGNFSGNISADPVSFAAYETIRLVAPATADADLADVRVGVRMKLA